jgi:hypothetical protein
MPLAGLVNALQPNAVPKDKDWFAYKQNEAEPRGVVAASLDGSFRPKGRPATEPVTRGAGAGNPGSGSR